MTIKIKVLTKSNLDINKLFTHVGHINDITPGGTSRFTAKDGSHNYKFDVKGSGFKYLGDFPKDGAVSRITIDKGSSHQLQIDLSPKLEIKKALKASSLESFINSQSINFTGGNGNDKFTAGKKNDTLKGGKGNDILSGRDSNDKIYGDDGNDTLNGDSGNDQLFGGKGNDTLRGSNGKDVLTGDHGFDKLIGGLHADRFDFNKISDSLVGSKRDVIYDFSRSQGDRIDLRGIDANTKAAGDQKFTFIGKDAFTKVAGQLRQKGDIVQGDVNGDGKADFEIKVANAADLIKGDFLL